MKVSSVCRVLRHTGRPSGITSTGEDSPLNRAECGEGEDREQQGPSHCKSGQCQNVGWVGGPGSKRTVNKEEGVHWGQKGHQRQKAGEAGNQDSPLRPERLSVQQAVGEIKARTVLEDEQVSLAEGRALSLRAGGNRRTP